MAAAETALEAVEALEAIEDPSTKEDCNCVNALLKNVIMPKKAKLALAKVITDLKKA